MDFAEFIQRLDLEANIIAFSLVTIALALLLFVNRKRLQTHLREWRIQRCLSRIGSDQIRNFVCADGLDGICRIDRLALTRDSILLISYKPYVGNIYCAERISEWTQVIGRQSFKFENPLFELENQLTALKLLIGNTPLRGYLFFNRSATFPKGHPPAVLNLESLPDQYLAENCQPVKPEVQLAWNQLKAHQGEIPVADRVGVKT